MRHVLTGGLKLTLLAASSAGMASSGGTVRPQADVVALPYDEGAIGLLESIRRLQTRASLIAVVAHPDDEDGSLLTREARGRGTRTVLMTLTRGEGGENAMGGDFGMALGLVRTQELHQATRYYAAENYFGDVIDYGFSKTPEEAAKNWGADTALEQVVRIIRKTRPLVITSSFVGAPTDGHGHHQMAGISAQKAYVAAADPAAFPDQIKEGLRPWRALKVYGRAPFARLRNGLMYDYATGRSSPIQFTNHTDGSMIRGELSRDVVVPVGTVQPASGRSHAQIAREGLRLQKSQGAGSHLQIPGDQETAYHLFASRVAGGASGGNMFDGIDTRLSGIADLAPEQARPALRRTLLSIDRRIGAVAADLDPRDPSAVAPALAEVLGQIRRLRETVGTGAEMADVAFELGVKQDQAEEALGQALSLSAVAVLRPAAKPSEDAFRGPLGTYPRTMVPGAPVHVALTATAQSPSPVVVRGATLEMPSGKDWKPEAEGPHPQALIRNQRASFGFQALVPADEPVTGAYYVRPSEFAGRYAITDRASLNQPYAPFPIIARLDLNFAGQPISIRRIVQGMDFAKALGWLPRPAVVVPRLSATISTDRSILPLAGGGMGIAVTVMNSGEDRAAGSVRLSLPKGWSAQPAQLPFFIPRQGETQQLTFRVETGGAVAPGRHDISAEVSDERGSTTSTGYRLVGYEGLASYPLQTPARETVAAVDVTVPKGLSIAYVPGTGDDLPGEIEGLGIQVTQLSGPDLATADLSRFDAVVVGVGGYARWPELAANNARLLAYARDGGTFLRQGTVGWDAALAPYPVTVGETHTQITEEDSPVTILKPADPILLWPNRIAQADFDGWVEQRGDGFLSRWDDRYVALLEMQDTGQAPERGGLVMLPYGKGRIVYSALAFYREVPAGVPGAIRLLVNLLAQRRMPAKG